MLLLTINLGAQVYIGGVPITLLKIRPDPSEIIIGTDIDGDPQRYSIREGDVLQIPALTELYGDHEIGFKPDTQNSGYKTQIALNFAGNVEILRWQIYWDRAAKAA